MKKKNILEESINDSIKLKLQLLNLKSDIDKSINLICKSLKNKGKIIFCGNGGSAGDSQHLAAELMGRYKIDRDPLPAIALTVDT